MKNVDNEYRLLIEGLKQEYIGREPFSKYSDLRGEELRVEENAFRDLIEGSFSITVTCSNDERYKQMKKYDIISKSDQKKWSFLLVPTGTLFAKSKINLRKKWIEQYFIRGIITLKNSFFGAYAMPVSVILLDGQKSSVWLTSATSTDDIIEILSDISQYKRKVYYTEALDPESFMPEFYNEEMKQINKNLDKYNTKELQDVAEIILGKNVDRWDFAEEGIPYIRVRNVQNGKICNLDSFVRPDCAEKYAKQLLQEGDVLLSKNFGQHKVTRVSEDDLPSIASNGFFIIRAYDVPEDYLYQYFTSETGKAILEKQLSSIEHGTIVASISKKDLLKLRVPIFDEPTMIDMGNIEKANVSDLFKYASQYKRISVYANKLGLFRGSAIEQSIYQQFLQTGWNEDEVLLDSCNYSIQIEENVRWSPDIVLLNGNAKLAVVEAKSDLLLIPPHIIKNLQYVIYNSDIPFVILATTGYFEIHSQGNILIKKCTTAPTKEELLQLLERKEEA